MTSFLKIIKNNKQYSVILSVLIILYSALAAPALPNSVILFFDTWYGKLLFLFLIGFVASHNIQVALVIAVLFFVILNMAIRLEAFEGGLTSLVGVDTKNVSISSIDNIKSGFDENTKRLIEWTRTDDGKNYLKDNKIFTDTLTKNMALSVISNKAKVPSETVKYMFDNMLVNKDFTKEVNDYEKVVDSKITNTEKKETFEGIDAMNEIGAPFNF